MGDAVIVSAARTADRHGPQGLARRLHRVRPGQVRDRRGPEALGHPGRGRRRHRPRRGAPGRRRHRPLRRGRARPDRRARRRAQPPLRVRAWRRCRRPRPASAPAWTASSSRAGARASPVAAGLPEAARHLQRRAAVAVAEPPRDARRADHGHVDHGRLEHRAEVQRHARGAGRLGVPLAHARDRGDRRGPVQGRDLRRSRSRSGRARPASSTSTSTRGATRRWRSSPRSRRCTPRSPGFSITAGNSSGLNDGSCAMVVCRLRLRGGQRPRAARDRALVGVGRASARRHRPRPDGRDPEGARARRPAGRRRRARRDQRGVRVDGGRVEPDPRLPATRSST